MKHCSLKQVSIEDDIRNIVSIEVVTKNDLNGSNIETCFVINIKFWSVTLTKVTDTKK